MDPLLRLTMLLDRIRRQRWSRTKALYALAILIGALAIVAVDRLGFWPDAFRSESRPTRSIFSR